jgi:hypothetical protein
MAQFCPFFTQFHIPPENNIGSVEMPAFSNYSTSTINQCALIRAISFSLPTV